MTIAGNRGPYFRAVVLTTGALAALLMLAGCARVTSPQPPSQPEPAPAPAPAATSTQTPEPEATEVKATPHVRLTVLYDNDPPLRATPDTTPALRDDWGFACLVEREDTTVLFDTGADAAILRNNLRALDTDPADIDSLVLSHAHSDHTGGIEAVLGANPALTVFVPASFPHDLKSRIEKEASLVEITGASQITEGVRTTGEMGKAIVEQSLLVDTARGTAVITGCAHPGIVKIVRAAASEGPVELVMGGFHLRDTGATKRGEVVSAIEGLGVARVAPTHCTGDAAKRDFSEVFGERYVPVGLGSIIEIGP